MKKKTIGYLKRATLVLGLAAFLMPSTALAEGSGASRLPAAQQQNALIPVYSSQRCGNPGRPRTDDCNIHPFHESLPFSQPEFYGFQVSFCK